MLSAVEMNPKKHFLNDLGVFWGENSVWSNKIQ